MIDIEPVKFFNGHWKVRWQPQLNGERLYEGDFWSSDGSFTPRALYRSQARARRIAMREWRRRERKRHEDPRETWTEVES